MAMPNHKTPPVRPRKVHFFLNDWDHDVALYGAVGMSTAFIQKETGLSPSQISYRLKAGGLTTEKGTSRMDFRNGKSPFAQAMLKSLGPMIDKQLVRHLRENHPA